MDDRNKYVGYLNNSVNRVYFSGIGGIGMCGLAEYLLAKGYSVSGSDPVRTRITERLIVKGAVIYEKQEKKNIDSDIDLFVYSSAIKEDNPELIAAKALGINCIKRAVLLGEIVNEKFLIAVSGTHGKTTTSGMISKIMIDAGLDPTVFAGGNMNFLEDASFRSGKSNLAVVEADEYDRSFLTLYPDVIVINNIELDHTDIYSTENELVDSFRQFINARKINGMLICNGEDKNIISITENAGIVKYFGKDQQFDIKIMNIGDDFCEFDLNGIIYRIGVTGYHNVYNATAAIVTAQFLNIEPEIIKASLSDFRGVSRRLEKKFSGRITVFDDYAHHPTEIFSSLRSLKDISKGRVIVVFQPHTFSRVAKFYKEFAKALEIADEILLMPVYAAREKNTGNVSSSLIFDELIKKNKSALLVSDEDELKRKLQEILIDGDLIVFQGAGDITNFCNNYINSLIN